MLNRTLRLPRGVELVAASQFTMSALGEHATKSRAAACIGEGGLQRGAASVHSAQGRFGSIALVRCLVPGCAGVIYAKLRREGLWDKFYMDAPARQRQCVEQYNIVKRA